MKNLHLANWSEDVYRLARDLSLGVEIQNFCFPSNIENPEPAIDELQLKLRDFRQLSLHGPFLELIPASLDAEIRKVTRNRFSTAYDIVERLKAKNLILHSGYIPKTYTHDVWLETSVNFWQEFLFDKKDKDIEIHVENVYENDFALIRELVDAIDSPNFSICLDIGHVNVNSPYSLEVWIKELNDRIRYVHLHNNEGICDDHYGLWKGNIKMLRVLDQLNTFSPQAIWTTETQIEDIGESINWLMKQGFLKR